MLTVRRSLLPALSIVCLLSLVLYISRLSPSRFHRSSLPPVLEPFDVGKELRVEYSLGGTNHSFGYLTTHPLSCVNGSQYLIAVISAPEHEAAREAIRETWGGHARALHNVPVVFLLGDTPDPRVQLALEDEDAHHGDIVQADFVDSYRNLSLKSLAMLRWTAAYCPGIRFLVKVDDDIFLNVDPLLEALEGLQDAHALYGLLAHRWRPITNNSSKWYLSPEEFSDPIFPDFVTGPTYVVGGKAIAPMLAVAHQVPLIYLEDVYLTGLVAERAGVRRKALSGINNLRVTFARYKLTFNSHGHSPSEMKVMWRRLFARSRRLG